MSSKNTAVFGIFASEVEAERAVDLLIAANFPSSSISVLLPDKRSTNEFAHEKHTKAPEGTTTGATVGGVIGGALGVLAGAGALAIPGIGPIIAAGPLMAGLAGLGAGGAVGGLVGALVGMGIPEYEAKRYEGRVKDGGTLLSVHCDTSDQVTRAKHLLAGAEATDISSTSESASAKDRDDDSDETTRISQDAQIAQDADEYPENTAIEETTYPAPSAGARRKTNPTRPERR
jgi:hypothetical protein